MEIDRAALRQNIIDRANVAGLKSSAPEIYHIVVLLLAYVDRDYSQVDPPIEPNGWFKAKPSLSTAANAGT